jgi:prophage regulatory protein
MKGRDMELDRMLRIAETCRIAGVSNATIWRWIKLGCFPAPVKLGPNSVGWRESAVREWLESLEPVGGTPEQPPSENGGDPYTSTAVQTGS